MKKDELNTILREYAKNHLSPTAVERAMISKIYASICDVLGERNCLQIGSYPRYTAVTPVHDLDVLFVLGAWYRDADPSDALSELQSRLEKHYENPTPYTIKIKRQTHSITIQFSQGTEEVFATDIVPAYVSGKNEFGDDTYMVPELLHKSRIGRQRLYDDIAARSRMMTWIKSDPRGYISVAAATNEANGDFRKTVKLVKAWRASCKEMDESFALKAFHIEQVVTAYFHESAHLEVFDAMFRFFRELPEHLNGSHIPDRADAHRHIDEYVNSLTEDEKQAIIEARDFFLIKLESIEQDNVDVRELLKPGRRKRASMMEAYLFDYGIPVLVEHPKLKIVATALERAGSFRRRLLDLLGRIEIDRKIQFRADELPVRVDLYKWKVKNDDKCSEPRGEITDFHTRHDPENTKFNGAHYVECYAIRNGVCIAKGRQNVVLDSPYR